MRKKPNKFKTAFRLLKLIKPLLGYMFLAIAMGILGHLSATFITILGGFGIASLMTGKTYGDISLVFYIMAVLAILRGILRYGEQSCNHFIAFKLLALIRNDVFKALRRLCPAKLDRRDNGDLISLITSDIELLEVFYAHTISPVAIAGIFSLIMVLFLGSYHWSFALIGIIAYGTVGIIIPLLVSKNNKEVGPNMREASGKLSAMILDSLRGMEEIVQYNSFNLRMKKLDRRTENLMELDRQIKKNLGINMAVTNGIILFFDLIMIVVGASLYMNQQIEIMAFIIPVIGLFSSFGPVIALANLGTTLESTFAAGDRVIEILDEEPVVEEIHGKKNIEFRNLTMENVGFSYNDQKEEVIKNSTLVIRENSITGIVGKSGSGKSTILKLMMRFWKASRGDISISDISIEEINTENLRELESLVSQDTELFHDTIANNIKIGKLEAKPKEVIEACKKAAIHEFIMKLPKGYDTQVGELGETLSGGERQRIGLARAFIHNSPLMLLDEPTSNLDSLNEGIILNSLEKEKGKRTIILVSHRKSTVALGEKIYLVEEGRVS